MRCIPIPAIFLRNLTYEKWTLSRAGMDAIAEILYILAPVGIFLLLAVVPSGLPQVSWDTCLDVYGPVSKSTHTPRVEDRRPSITHVAKAWAVKPFNSFSSSLLFASAFWQLGASRDRAIASARTPQFMWLRLVLLLAIPAVAVYATLSLDYSEEGLFAMLLNCLTHMIDVVVLVFGDTQLSIETWG